jgi:hypothetical protein
MPLAMEVTTWERLVEQASVRRRSVSVERDHRLEIAREHLSCVIGNVHFRNLSKK